MTNFYQRMQAARAARESTLATSRENDSDEKQEEVSAENDGEESTEDGPSRAIRKFCLECVGTHPEIRLCCAFSCPLWDHRFGVRPSAARRRHPEMMDREHVRQLVERRRGGAA